MLAWLSANGYAKDSLEGQARYMAHEAMTRFPHTRGALIGATGSNLESTAIAIGHDFEAPAPGPGAGYPARASNARRVFGRDKTSDATASPWQNFTPPNVTLPQGHGAADPFGFHADVVRRAQQGSWSNSVTNHNVNMGGQKTTINIDGAGMDPHSMADMIGRKQVRVHADFLRNAKSAIA